SPRDDSFPQRRWPGPGFSERQPPTLPPSHEARQGNRSGPYIRRPATRHPEEHFPTSRTGGKTMTVELTTDTEAARQEQLTELIAEHGPGWLEEFKPGSLGCHQLLDRAAFLAKTVDNSLLSHPACVRNPDWYALADEALTA